MTAASSTLPCMRDRDVRRALHARLESEHAHERSQTLLLDELGLCGEARVDVAVVNGALSGFELKSAADTLTRLPRQIEVYSRVLDYATLVVAHNHVDAALSLTPRWWGCIVARSDRDDVVALRQRRKARLNPAIDSCALVQLLWRDEALAILERHDAARGLRTKPRAALWAHLARTLPQDALRREVRGALRGRTSWRAAG